MEVMVRHNVVLIVTRWRRVVEMKTKVQVGTVRKGDVMRASRGISWWMMELEPCSNISLCYDGKTRETSRSKDEDLPLVLRCRQWDSALASYFAHAFHIRPIDGNVRAFANEYFAAMIPLCVLSYPDVPFP